MQDLIYRQEAIDAMHQYSYFNDFDVSVIDEDLAVIALKDLPSAQPEQQWISCSESRPKHGVVLVTYNGGEIDLLRFPTAYRAKDIIAWMPLPEPPKEDNNDHT